MWLRPLIERIFQDKLSYDNFRNEMISKLRVKLEKLNLPSYVTSVDLGAVSFGDNSPVVTDVTLLPSTKQEGVVRRVLSTAT